jgi:hypothetical protein
MSLRLKSSRGQMFVMMTLALTALLAALALGTDVAVIYFNWMQLRKAADSSALAGAAWLGPFASQTIPSSSCSWGNGATPAYDVACAYAEQNGIASSEIVSIGPATTLPANVTVPAGAQTIEISLRRTTIPMFFARLVMPNQSDFATAVNAIAVGPAPLQTMSQGMFPAGLTVQPSTSEAYPQSITLTEGDSGNFVWLDLPTCSPVGSAPPADFHGNATDLENAISGGSTCSYSIGDTIGLASSHAVSSANIENAMSERIQDPGSPPPPLEKLSSANPQLAVVPLVSLGETTGAHGRVRQTATVQGFATIWLSNYSGGTITGDFMQFAGEYGVGGARTAYGAYSIPYLID